MGNSHAHLTEQITNHPVLMPPPSNASGNIGVIKHAFAFAAFLLIGILLYGHTLNVPFYLDDSINVRDRLYAMKALSFHELTKASFESFALRRPLANLSFALNYYFHGLQPAGYHVVNIAIHILNGALLYLLIFKTLTLPGHRDRFKAPARVAFFAALLWFVNPMQTQAVTYVIQRMTGMAALFFLGALMLYVYGRLSRRGLNRIVLFSASVLCWVLAMACKEIAVTLPGVIYIYEWFFFQNLNLAWLKRTSFIILAGFAGMLGAIYLFYHYTPLNFLTEVWQSRGFTALERFLTEGRVIFFYLSLLAYPDPGRLSLNHDFSVSRSLFNPATTLLSFAGLAALLVLTILIMKRHRIVAFSIAWFLSNVAIEALAADLELIFEHRVYLPSMLLFLPFVWLCFRQNNSKLAISLMSVVILVFSFWTYQRNALWNDPVSFWQEAVAKSPNHYRGYASLGTSYLGAKAYEPAQKAFEKALSLAPPYPTEIYGNLGLVHLKRGHLSRARENLRRALSLNRNNYVALDLLGTVSRREKKDKEAIGWYRKALEINPGYASAYYNLATLYNEMGDTEKALKALQEALALRPMWAEAYSALGLIQAQQSHFDLAESALSRAIDLEPANTEALFNLAKVYELTGRPALAAEMYETLLGTAPNDLEAMHNLGILYATNLKDDERARFYLRKALDFDPDYPRADVARKILSQLGERD